MQLFSNNAQSTLAVAITNVATSLTVANGEGSRFPNPTGGDYFIATLYKLSGITESTIEIVKCTARSGDVLTIVRAQEGSAAASYASGDNIALRLTAGAMSTDSISEGATNKYFSAARVLSVVLTGLNIATNQAVTAADTVLQAIGYLQKQISDAVTSLAGKQSTLVSGTSIKTVNSNSLLGSGDVAVGYANIPQNSQSAAYTLVLNDANKHILHPTSDNTARTFTIPANSSVAFPIGTALTFVNQASAGVVTIAITSDVMRIAGAGTTGSRTLAANGLATALKITSTEWIISGVGLT